jgi:hypothetical protein
MAEVLMDPLSHTRDVERPFAQVLKTEILNASQGHERTLPG